MDEFSSPRLLSVIALLLSMTQIDGFSLCPDLLLEDSFCLPVTKIAQFHFCLNLMSVTDLFLTLKKTARFSFWPDLLPVKSFSLTLAKIADFYCDFFFLCWIFCIQFLVSVAAFDRFIVSFNKDLWIQFMARIVVCDRFVSLSEENLWIQLQHRLCCLWHLFVSYWRIWLDSVSSDVCCLWQLYLSIWRRFLYSVSAETCWLFIWWRSQDSVFDETVIVLILLLTQIGKFSFCADLIMAVFTLLILSLDSVSTYNCWLQQFFSLSLT